MSGGRYTHLPFETRRKIQVRVRRGACAACRRRAGSSGVVLGTVKSGDSGVTLVCSPHCAETFAMQFAAGVVLS